MHRRETVRDDWDPGSTCLMKREMAAEPAIPLRPQLLAGRMSTATSEHRIEKRREGLRHLEGRRDRAIGKFVVPRVPYPLGFYSRGLDGRIDDPKELVG